MDALKKYWPEAHAFIVFLGVLALTFHQSVLSEPRHFIIPTRILAIGVVIANVIYYSLKGHKWAKICLFWTGCLAEFLGFLSLFNSPTLAKTYYGSIWAGIIVAVLIPIFGYLLYSYQKSHELFKD